MIPIQMLCETEYPVLPEIIFSCFPPQQKRLNYKEFKLYTIFSIDKSQERQKAEKEKENEKQKEREKEKGKEKWKSLLLKRMSRVSPESHLEKMRIEI